MAWLAGWNYRKAIIVNHTDDGAQTDYQLKLLVGETSGAVGEDVDCGGLVASDFDDLRFTTSDGTTLCSYYIENISGTTPNQLATVWVKIPAIAAHPNDTTIYMYYGGTQTAVSSGINTFGAGLFDDFEWGSDEDNIDTSGGNITWTKTVAGTSTAKIDTAQKYNGTRSLRLYRDGTNDPYAKFTKVAGTNYAIRWWWQKDDASQPALQHGNGTNDIALFVNPTEDIYYWDGAGKDTGSNATKDVWQLYELTDINHATPKFDIWFQGAKIKDDATLVAEASASGEIWFRSQVGTANVWVDCVIVRKWTTNEPTWNSFGAEETSVPKPKNQPAYAGILQQ